MAVAAATAAAAAASASASSAGSPGKHNKLKLREVNRHLVCRLCRGYYVDATTIAECLHSFCRSCIIKYLEKNSFCPICEVQIHKTKPYLNLRLDKALQDVVYKLVPGLYHNEMKRRREFYSKHPDQVPAAASEECGLEERIIFSPEDSISLSLEYLEGDDFESETVSSQSSESGDGSQDGGNLSFPQQLGLMKLKNPQNNNEGKNSRRESQDVQENSTFPKRYLQCPAVVSVFHLKKFIRMKHDLTDRMQVDIIHKRVPLPDYYTLMDVAYIYTWKRSAPMRFFYQIYHTKRHKIKVPAVQPSEISSVPQNAKENAKPTKSSASAPPTNPPSSAQPAKGVSVVHPVESTKSTKNDNKSEKISREKQVTSEVKPNSIAETGMSTTSSTTTTTITTTTTTTTTVSATTTTTEKPGLKNVVSKKSELETKKLESASKLERIVNGIKRDEKRLEAEMERKKAETSKTNKSDKSDPVAVNDKVNSEKPETVKQDEGKGNAKDVITAKGNERLLLNPVSGQLELVPLEETKPTKTTTTATTTKTSSGVIGNKQSVNSNSKKENVESGKKRLAEEKVTSPESEGLSIEKRSFVNSLKTFRKDRPNAVATGAAKAETRNSKGNALTITPVSKSSEKPQEKETEKQKPRVEISKDKSEYDFDGESSPPSKIMPLQHPKSSKGEGTSKETKNSWMSLQDFRMQMCKENNISGEETEKKDRRKSVPSLYRINSETNKKLERKTPNGKGTSDKTNVKKSSPTIINIKTEDEDSGGKTEINIEVPTDEKVMPPMPIMIENRGGEYSIKQKEESNPKKSNKSEARSGEESKKQEEEKSKSDEWTGKNPQDLLKELLMKGKDQGEGPEESEIPKKKSKPNVEKANDDQIGAMDLSKSESSPKSLKNPLENLIDLANKTGTGKSDENMVEALISVAQKQSIEPLLKIPHFSQNAKGSQDSPPLSKNISSNDISQALQFFKDLRSDIKVLEAKSQMSPNSFLEQFPQKTTNLEPIQLYQQHIDLIRRLKRQQQMAGNDAESPHRKQPKLSPPVPDHNPKVSSSDEAALLKSSVERTLCQIQEQMEIQNRMVVAQNYKNLLQYYGARPPVFCPPQTSPPKSSQNRLKTSSHSTGSQKSPDSKKTPHNLTSPSGSSSMGMGTSEGPFLNNQYRHLINAGLNSEMTFHQMFQNYLMQQKKINRITTSFPPKTFNECYLGNHPKPKGRKKETGSVPTAQET